MLHKLEPSTSKRTDLQCRLCRRDIDTPAKAWRCQKCSFDVCGEADNDATYQLPKALTLDTANGAKTNYERSERQHPTGWRTEDATRARLAELEQLRRAGARRRLRPALVGAD